MSPHWRDTRDRSGRDAGPASRYRRRTERAEDHEAEAYDEEPGPRYRGRYDYTDSPNPKRFYRSRRNKVISGVCGGIADYFGWDVTWVRLGTLASMSFMGPAPLIGYFIASMVMPVRPYEPRLTAEEDQFWRSVQAKPTITLSNLRYKFKDMEERLARMERVVTSEEWNLERQFRDLERGA
jgi:phage shock protein C